MDLRGKRVLITGASRGIGESFAHAFAGAGAKVALVARTREALDTLATYLGGTAHAADLTYGRAKITPEGGVTGLAVLASS